LTKDLDLAGLRLGYALAAPPIVDLLDRVRPPWNVNAAAQAAGLAALADGGHLVRAREVVFQSRAYLVAELRALGFVVYPPAANFVLVRVGDGRAWRERLLRRGLCVRDCASFGLPDCIRIGVRTGPECERLIQGIQMELRCDQTVDHVE
jgi:histidinol-phosphate aminotransferase